MSEGSALQVEQGSVQPAAAPVVAAPTVSIPKASPPGPSAPVPPASKAAPAPSTGGWWTLPVMSLGIALIACSLIVGQVEDNRQLAWQKNKLQMDLDYLNKQAAVNAEFLTKLSTDANLVERLAQRQMKLVREGATVLDLKTPASEQNSSAFKLVRLPPPPQVKPYEPAPGMLTRLFGTDRQRLVAIGLGAILVAMGLLFGSSDEKGM